MDAMVLSGLTHLHPGGRGVADLDLTVPQGSLFGFLGPNGAGKTTTIRLLLDFLRPHKGTASILGLDPWKDGVRLRGRIGYLPGEVHLPETWTGMEFLAHGAAIRGHDLPRGDLGHMVKALDATPEKRLKTLSKGNKQKIAIIHALLFAPDLVILDEPTEGLDPLVQQAFHDLLNQYRSRGGTVFMSSHVLSEVERVCDRVAIIRSGRLVTVSRIADLLGQKARRLDMTLSEDLDEATVLSGFPGSRLIRRNERTWHLEVPGKARDVVAHLANMPVLDVTISTPSLEDSFLEYYS